MAETKSLRPVALHDSAEYFPLDYGGSPYQWPDGVTEIMPTNSSWAAFQYHAPGLGGFAFVFVLTQLTVWPAAYYLRKLPVLNKMF